MVGFETMKRVDHQTSKPLSGAQVPHPEAWYQANDLCRESLGLNGTDIGVRVYRGLQHALWEITEGLARLFPHRRTMSYVNGSHPQEGLLARSFSGQLFKVKRLNREDVSGDFAWLSEVEKELLFHVHYIDHAITGEVFDPQPLRTATQGKRFVRIFISHSYHQVRTWSLEPENYDINLFSIRPDLCIALTGARVKVQPLFAEGMDWSDVTSAVLQSGFAKISEEPSLVQTLEQNPPAGASALLAPNTPRLFHQALLYWPDLDGSSVVHALTQAWSKEPLEPGAIDTLSLCRQPSLKFLDWYRTSGLGDEQIRGSVIFSAQILKRPDLKSQLESAVNQIRKTQLGA